MKIDIFAHIMPKKYSEAVAKVAPKSFYNQKTIEATPTLYDLNHRFRIMDRFEGLMQVLSISAPGVEEVADSEKTADLAKLANDEMAELVMKYPDRFAAAVACLPMNNMDAALDELERAVNELKFRGVQIATPINGKPLDSPEFMPLYEKMSQYNLPIWIHPMRPGDYPDYRTEDRSRYRINVVFGWLYETTAALTRLVFSGILEQYPNLKIIAHHAGGMVPFVSHRIMSSYDRAEMRENDNSKRGLTRAPIEYFKMFYCDTAINGNTAGLMCAYSFFGADHMMFGTDMPFDSQLGERNTRETIASIERMDIPETDKQKIFVENARKLLRLPV